MTRCLARFAACLALLLSLPAGAGTPLLIWPIDPVIPPGQPAAALWLENHGTTPATLQVRIFGWTQAGGEDRYEAQPAVLPSPPIATIAPGGRQLVRLIATRPAPPQTEQAYRIFIDELPAPTPAPTPADAAAAAAPGSTIKLQLRYAVPLFVYGQGAILPPTRTRDGLGGPDRNALLPVLDWDQVQEAGKPVLVLHNSGNAHARVTAVEWTGSDSRAPGTPGTKILNPGLLGYVLAGSSARFPLVEALPRNAVLRAQLNGRPADLRRAAD